MSPGKSKGQIDTMVQHDDREWARKEKLSNHLQKGKSKQVTDETKENGAYSPGSCCPRPDLGDKN